MICKSKTFFGPFFLLRLEFFANQCCLSNSKTGPLELTLISQIIPFMYIVGKQKGAQHGLKGKCALVLVNLKKIQGITSTLLRTVNDETVIS